MKKLQRLVPLFIIIVVAALMVYSGVFAVDETEEAVILRLGRYNRTVGPGLHTKIPFGIERSYKVPTQVIQNMAFGFRVERAGVNTVFSNVDYPEESIMLTGDLNIIDVEWIIQYRIVDPLAWLFNVENQQQTIRDVSQSVVNLLVGDRSIFDVLGSGRSNVEDGALLAMNGIFDSFGLGIRVTQVRLQNIVPPVGRVQDAFEDVNKAIQDMNRLINEGRQQYNSEIPRVRGEAQAVVNIAEGYRSRRVNRAEGEVDRFNAIVGEYLAAPELTRTRLYYEALEEVFSNADETILIDKGLENIIPLANANGILSPNAGSSSLTTPSGQGVPSGQ